MGDIIVGILAIVCFLMLFIGLPVSVYLETKREARERKDREAADNLWLEAEKKMPLYQVEFELTDGTKKRTRKFHPFHSSRPGSAWNERRTSVWSANAVMEQSYKEGFMQDVNMVTYPTCNILNAKIAEEQK